MIYLCIVSFIVGVGVCLFAGKMQKRNDWVLKNSLEYIDRVAAYAERNNLPEEEALKYWHNIAPYGVMWKKFWITDMREFAKDKALYDEFEQITKREVTEYYQFSP